MAPYTSQTPKKNANPSSIPASQKFRVQKTRNHSRIPRWKGSRTEKLRLGLALDESQVVEGAAARWAPVYEDAVGVDSAHVYDRAAFSTEDGAAEAGTSEMEGRSIREGGTLGSDDSADGDVDVDTDHFTPNRDSNLDGTSLRDDASAKQSQQSTHQDEIDWPAQIFSQSFLEKLSIYCYSQKILHQENDHWSKLHRQLDEAKRDPAYVEYENRFERPHYEHGGWVPPPRVAHAVSRVNELDDNLMSFTGRLRTGGIKVKRLSEEIQEAARSGLDRAWDQNALRHIDYEAVEANLFEEEEVSEYDRFTASQSDEQSPSHTSSFEDTPTHAGEARSVDMESPEDGGGAPVESERSVNATKAHETLNHTSSSARQDNGSLDGEEKDKPDLDRGRGETEPGAEILSWLHEGKVPFVMDSRAKFYAGHWEMQEIWEKWRNDYPELLRKHQRGINPGMACWNPSWSRTEFDIKHLEKAMRLSRLARMAGDLYDRTLSMARYLKLPPHEDQEFNFADQDDDGYALSWENARAAVAPKAAIRAWLDGLPANPVDLAGGRPLLDADHNPGNYASEHPIAWPSALVDSGSVNGVDADTDFADGAAGAIDPGDSCSCAAEKTRKHWIEEQGPGQHRRRLAAGLSHGPRNKVPLSSIEREAISRPVRFWYHDMYE